MLLYCIVIFYKSSSKSTFSVFTWLHLNTLGGRGWENSRKLCKPLTVSRICINFYSFHICLEFSESPLCLDEVCDMEKVLYSTVQTFLNLYVQLYLTSGLGCSKPL